MQNINVSYLYRLRNQAFPEAFSTICSILDRSEIAEEYLAACLAKAKAHIPKLVCLKNMNLTHPLTKKLSDMKYERHDYFLAIKGRVSNNLRSPKETERKASAVLDLWLHGYRQYLATASINEQNNLVIQMADDISSDLEIATAMDDADCSDIFSAIESLSINIKDAILKRSADRVAKRRKADVVRRAAYKDMKTLLNGIDMAINLGSDDSSTYVGYRTEISDILNQFNAKTMSRATRKKNAEDAQKDREEGNSADGGARGMEVLGNSMMTPKMAQPKSTTMSGPYSVLAKHEDMGMDLQKGDSANASLTTEPLAMSESETNGGSLVDNDKKAEATATGNGDLGNNALGDAPQNGDTDMRQGRADVDNNSDQEE